MGNFQWGNGAMGQWLNFNEKMFNGQWGNGAIFNDLICNVVIH